MSQSAAAVLSAHFLARRPVEAARVLETWSGSEIDGYLAALPVEHAVPVLNAMTPTIGAAALEQAPPAMRRAFLEQPERNRALALLAQLPADRRDLMLSETRPAIANELRAMLVYPEATAGRLMDTAVFCLPSDVTVGQALVQLRQHSARDVSQIKLLDRDNRLTGIVDVRRLAFNGAATVLADMAAPVSVVVAPTAPREDVVQQFEAHGVAELIVVDLDGRALGVIRHNTLLGAVKDEVSLDIQTMVGVSKDERALSSSWFALRKRMPWLQVNLLTAFLAAAVVGLFQDMIATFTALAVLLPVVAGQSGNAGAQALAVTMRGLALREITVSQWVRVTRKEINTGFWNGLAVALTCGIGVYLWSGSIGLVLVIALAMVIAMVMAGIAGALVPIVLARLNQDPAVASSIILTTVTDVVGFFSFLGIAASLTSLLV